MCMRMHTASMPHRIASMAVRVKMNRSIAVAMGMEMHTVTPKPPEHVRSKTHHHDADGPFKRLCDMLRNGMSQDNRGTRKQRERNRVAKSPRQSVPNNVSDIGSAGGDAGDGCNMIGFQRMLHSQHKTESQNSKHCLHSLF